MDKKRIKVVIANQHKLCCEGIIILLNDFDFISSAIECHSGAELIEKLESELFDVVITDCYLPDISGVQLTRRIKEKTPKTKVICLSEKIEMGCVVKLIEAGATSYLLKNCSIEELSNAIQAVHVGNSYFSKEVNMKLLSNLMKNHAHRISELALPITEREFEILKYIADEMTNKEIAEELFISSRTVDTHRRNLLHKLHARNTAGLVKCYLSVTGTNNVLL